MSNWHQIGCCCPAAAAQATVQLLLSSCCCSGHQFSCCCGPLSTSGGARYKLVSAQIESAQDLFRPVLTSPRQRPYKSFPVSRYKIMKPEKIHWFLSRNNFRFHDFVHETGKDLKLQKNETGKDFIGFYRGIISGFTFLYQGTKV